MKLQELKSRVNRTGRSAMNQEARRMFENRVTIK